jgi:hypothetical protein
MTIAGLRKFTIPAIITVALLLCGCNPLASLSKTSTAKSTFLVDDSRLFDSDTSFGMKDILVYPAMERHGPQNVSTGVPNPELTRYRCTWCHECGFTAAFDFENLNTAEWKPVYVGEAWKSIVYRMNDKDEALLNEQIAERIYTYLRDKSLGIYDEENDNSGKIIREVDDLSEVMVGPDAQVERSVEGEETAAPAADGEQAEPDSSAEQSADKGTEESA